MTSNSIRNIWAVGRNYGEHAKELGNATPTAEGSPMIFLKAGSSIVPNEGTFRLPSFTSDIHHEVEVVFQFGEVGGKLDLVAYTLGIDLTAREVQTKLKKDGHPWTLAKSFRDSCLLGPLKPWSAKSDAQAIDFTLKINGETRQTGHTRDMIFPVARQVAYVLECFPVVAGDLLMTGTPAGVGLVRAGDKLEAEIPGAIRATWTAARS